MGRLPEDETGGLCSAVLGLHSYPVPYIVVKKMAKSHFGVLSKGVFQINVLKNITGGCMENTLLRGQK